jgi:hypothetical protein
MGTIKTTNIEPIADNGTVTLGSSGDTFTMPSGVTVAGSMANTPAFLYTASSNQSISASTNTSLDVPTQVIDTDSAYDTTNKRFVIPSGKAGLYCFFIAYQYNGTATQNHIAITRSDSSGNVYQNGGTNIDGFYNLTQDIRGISHTMYYNCVVGDRIEARTQQFSGSTQTLYYPRTFFGGYKLIGV